VLPAKRIVEQRQWPAPLAAEAFYGLAGEFTRLVLPETEADASALLFSFIVALGSIMGRGPYYRTGATKHFCNLYLVIVGNTSKAREGTSWSEVHRVCEAIDIRWSKTRISSGLASGEGLIDAVSGPATESKPIREKGHIIGYQDEITNAGEADKRLLCMEPEFGRTLQCAAREESTLSPVIRQAWDGDTLRVLAKNAKATCAEPHISVVGHITDTELQKLLTASDAANGFSNRFLWCCSARSQCLALGGK
jgi:hypothetical protein